MRFQFGILFLALTAGVSHAESPPLRVPPGFTIERAVPENVVRFPMFATFDDRGRLFVAESAGGDLYEELKTQTRRCRISVLEDRDGDGAFETAQVFAKKLVCPMGLAWRAGKLYVADAPDLIRLEDTDGDGRADRRSVVLTGFGHTDDGSLHGLTFGPDGWLYFTMGEPDGYRLRRTDGSWLEGTSGALLRSRADGSAVEVVARGFGNLVEVAFLPAGEIIGTDNWFQLPADGIRDALVHLLPGGLYPYAPDRGTPQPVTGAPLPPLALYPAVAHSGLVRARAMAWGGDLFSAQHNTRKIIRHRLTRSGATFRAADENFVWTDDPDFHPADVLEAADGSLIVVDTGSWYIHHCPTGAIRHSPAPGGISRVRVKDKTAGGESSGEEAAWALARENSAASREKLRAQLADADDETVARAARALGRCADREAAPLLLPLLMHPAVSVQLAAAEALAECGDENCAAAVFVRLAEETDRFLEHALIHALHRRASTEQLTAALDRASPRVQRAALLLLDQPPRAALAAKAVVKRVSAEDAALRETAQTILQRHEEWFAEALPVLRKLLALATPDTAELTTLGGFARAFSNRPEVAALLAKVAGGETPATEPIRLAVLDEMAGVPRERQPAAWREAFAAALRSDAPAVRLRALRAIHALRLEGLDDPLAALARDPAADDALRVEALRVLIRLQPVLHAEAFAVVLRELARANPALRRLAAAELAAAAKLDGAQFTRFAQAVADDPMISPALVLAAALREPPRTAAAAALLDYLRASVQAGWQLSAQQLAALDAAFGDDPKLRELRAAIGASAQRQQAQLAALTPHLAGGDAVRGRVIFETKTACTACHRVGGNGGVIGPDLTKIGAIRAGRDLIEAIVMPSATFAQGYDTFTVTPRGGSPVTGIRVRRTDDALVLRDASGAEMRFTPADAATAERQKISLMPEGLLSALNESETRDLLAYLQSLK